MASSQFTGQPTIVRARPGWRGLEWREIVEYRDLLYFLVLRDVTVLYKQTILGFAWALINPFFSMVIFTIVFGRLVGVPSDGVPYAVFSYVALVPWTYFASAVTASSTSMIQATSVMTKVYFPRLFIPLVPVFSKLVDLAIASVLLAVLMVWFRVVPPASIVLLPMLLALVIVTAAGAGLWLSALAVQYRDVRHAVGVLVQLLMYAAPVVWPASILPERYRLVYGLYPMAGAIEGFRAAVLGATGIPWDLIGMGWISASALFVSGLFYFRRTERIFADVA